MPDEAAHPPIRTFKPRRRALTPARREQMERLGERWLLAVDGPVVEPADLFGRRAPLVIDIGIGIGDAFVSAAAAQPGIDVIGIDVHTPGIATSLVEIDALGLTNVRLVHGDALEFVDRVAPASVAGIRIYFPDPWPKARHRHRRIAGERHLARLVTLLEPGGWLDIATDVDDYAADVMAAASAIDGLSGGVVERPADRAVTRYERRAIDAGRAIIDMRFERDV